MTGIIVGYANSRRRLKHLVVIDGLKKGDRFLGVLNIVQGRGGIFKPAPLVFARFPQGFHFLDVGAVLQHEVQQFAGGLGAENGTGKALLDHLGQQAGVVNVGVGNKNKVNGGRLIEFRFAVAGFNGLVALMHAAINAKALASRLNHIT